MIRLKLLQDTFLSNVVPLLSNVIQVYYNTFTFQCFSFKLYQDTANKPWFPANYWPTNFAHRSLSYLEPNERPSSMAFYLKFIFVMSQPRPMQDKHMKQWFWGKIQCWHDRLCHCKKLILHEDYLACASLLYLLGMKWKNSLLLYPKM